MSRRHVLGLVVVLAVAAAAAVGAFGLPRSGSPPARASQEVSGATDSTLADARERASRAEATAGVAARPLAVRCARYAAPGGRDRNRGTKARPFRTAQRLADSLRAGQTGCLRGGVYDHVEGGYVLRVDHGGTRGAPITIRGYPGERARVVGIVNVPAGSNHVRLSAIRFRGTGGANTVKIYATNVLVQNSYISNSGRGESCMILGSTSGYGRATAVVVRRNRFHGCGAVGGTKDHAVYVSNAVNARIVGNVFWATGAYAIHLYPNARGTVIAHNVIDGGRPSTRGGVLFGGNSDFASSGNVVEYNVVAFARTSNITSNWDSGRVGSRNVARRNCLYGARDGNIDSSNGGFARAGNRVARPWFVDRQARDYRLRRTSRCLAVVGYDAAARLP
jgi:hypothetical protein